LASVVGFVGCGLLAGCLEPLPIILPDQGRDQGTLDGDVPTDAEPEDLGPPADLGPGFILEVGFGEPGSFMVAPGTGTATAVMGIQGGYHLDMGFRVRGLSAADFNSGDWIIAYEFRSAAGVALSEPITRILSLVGVSFDGTGQVRTGDRVFFLSSDPSVHSLTTITLEVSLTNGSTSVVDTAEVTLVVP
jgi:hypothetical protein